MPSGEDLVNRRLKGLVATSVADSAVTAVMLTWRRKKRNDGMVSAFIVGDECARSLCVTGSRKVGIGNLG